METRKITGTLRYVSGGALASYWGAGYFLVLKFADVAAGVTSLLVGLNPSAGSGLVEAIGDPDMNGVFKISNKNEQMFKVIATSATATESAEFDLSGLQLVAPLENLEPA